MMFAIRNAAQIRIAFALGLLLILLGSACSPSGPKALLQGEQLIKKGDYAAAIDKLEIAARKLPNFPQVWNFMGLAYHGQGKLNEAIGSYQKALNMDRNYTAAYYNMGLVLFDLNRLPESLSALTTFTMAQPNSEEAWLKIASIQLRMQKPEDAERAAAQALKINPNSPEAFNDLGIAALQRRKNRDALQWFDRALQCKADYAPAILNQAVILQGMPANKALALQRYKAYLSLEPNSKEAPMVRQNIAVLSAELAPPPVVETKTNTPPAVASETQQNPKQGSQPSPVAASQETARREDKIEQAQKALISQIKASQQTAASGASNNPAPLQGKAVASANLNEPQPHTIKSLRTNQVAANVAASSVKTSKPPAEAASPANEPPKKIQADTKAPELAQQEKLEKVTLPEDPALKPVRDITSESTNLFATADKPAIPEVSLPAASDASEAGSIEEPSSTPDQGEKEGSGKTGVMSKMNPANWFHWKKGKDKDEPAPAKTFSIAKNTGGGIEPVSRSA